MEPCVSVEKFVDGIFIAIMTYLGVELPREGG